MSAKFPPGLAVYLAGRVRDARRRYRRRLARCRAKFSEGTVHELRIEMRRILALLDLLAALRFARPLKKLARACKRCLDVFDELRDTQVQLRLLQPAWRKFPETFALKKVLRRQEKNLIARLARKVGSAKYARLGRRLKEVETCLGADTRLPSRETVRAPAATALRGSFRRVIARRKLVRRGNTAAIHRLRVAFKRFRYMCELLQPLLPWLTVKQLERMKRYQAAAGDIQDLEVMLERLDRAVLDDELEPGALKNLRDELLLLRREAIHSFMARIDDLFDFHEHHDAPRPGIRTRPNPNDP